MTLDRHRTSVSLEGHVWEGLTEICRREAVGIDTLCTEVDRRRRRSSMSSALRVFLLLYFRGLAEALETRTTPASGNGCNHLEAALDRLLAEEQAALAG